MTLTRRRLLHLAAGAAALPALSRIASAQAYPSRPVRLIVPIGAGGATDIFARLIGQWLSERLGQPFIIENRPGGGSNIGTEAAVRAPADGYTLLMAGAFNAINATLYDNLKFNFIRDTAPVAGVMRGGLALVVNQSVPADSLPALIAYAKANPGKISYGSTGVGSSNHLANEFFNMLAGLKMIHVPYRSAAPALTDLLGGQVEIMFASIVTALEYVKVGRLRALAVTTAARSDALPNIPTVSEFVPGYEASTWYGIVAPRNTPAEIIGRLNTEINAGLADAKIKERLLQAGGAPMPMTPGEFGTLIAAETEKWGKVIRAGNIKPE